MIFSRLFKEDDAHAAGRTLYEAAVVQARNTVFYADLAVPDTLDGRFENILLHVWLVLRRIRLDDAKIEHHDKVAQAVFDSMIADMDRSLREMGVGDLRVGKRVKAMAQAFYGHVKAYDQGIDADDDRVLGDTLLRNLYGTSENDRSELSSAAAAVAKYVRQEVINLENQSLKQIIGGEVAFGRPNSVESR
jgi:cytochrome b pre-mRNA-processing protein 3